MPTPSISIHPLTPDRWDDLVRLFGPRGACGGCWCMHWRLPRAVFERQKGAKNRAAMRRLVGRGTEPGVLAYLSGEPVGWCAVAPREQYVRLERARVLQRIDGAAVWSIVCLFVAANRRRQGISVALIDGAAVFAAARGATIVEGYPVDAGTREMPPVFAWTGTAAAFLAAGFTEAARGSPARPIMRRHFARERVAAPQGHRSPHPPQ
jgi:GNAT superfamily N-acetyltransferase